MLKIYAKIFNNIFGYYYFLLHILYEYYRIEGQINKQVIEGRRTNQFTEIVKLLAKVQSLFVLSVMNNFPSEDKEFQLCTSMFQNMFPTINVAKVNYYKACV